MTQAAVSYQVKSLEERLGAPLFVREKGRARLTPLGARLLPPLTSAFDTIEAAFASHREEDEIAADRHHHPHLRQHLARVAARRVPDGASRPRGADDDQQRDLSTCASGDADVAIRAGRGDWEGLEQHRLFESDFTPMASPDASPSVERKLGPQARAARHARPEPDQPERRLVAAMVRRQWRAGRRSGAAAGPASGSRTRPTRAMRRWPGRASRC